MLLLQSIPLWDMTLRLEGGSDVSVCAACLLKADITVCTLQRLLQYQLHLYSVTNPDILCDSCLIS